MYHMYSRSSQAQYLIDSHIILRKKSVPLAVQTIEGAVVQNLILFLFHRKRFWVRTPGEVKSLNYFKVSSKQLLYIISYIVYEVHSGRIFPGLLAGEIWFWADLKISFALAQHIPNKNSSQDWCSIPGWLQRCGLETAF